MALNRGKWFSPRDIKFIRSINNELLDDVIENIVTLFKIATETKTNIYGESDENTGKLFYAGVDISNLAERPDMQTKSENFGSDRDQNIIFKFLEAELQRLQFYPQSGDYILWNDKYFEVDNVVQEQLLGGQSDKSHSIICNTVYVDVTNLNIVERPLQ